MSNQLAITLLIYGMVQAVLFGIGMLAIMWTPLEAYAPYAIPAMIAVTAAISIPVAWKVAPILRARHQKRLAREDKLGAPYPSG